MSQDGRDGEVWPVRISKPLGLPAPVFAAPLVLALVIDIAPRLSPGATARSVAIDIFLHSVAGAVLVFLALGCLCAGLLARDRGELIVDESGIDVSEGGRRWFYAWSDIDCLTQTDDGVGVTLKGRSVEQNRYNMVSARFMGARGLRKLLGEGLDRFGGDASGPRASVAPGDDLRAARFHETGRLLAAMTGACVAMAYGLTAWLSLDALGELRTRTGGAVLDAALHAVAANAALAGGMNAVLLGFVALASIPELVAAFRTPKFRVGPPAGRKAG